MIETNSKIVLQGVKKAFGLKSVLNGVNLKIGRGESLVVIGGSGTGKSVLLKNILGLLTPDEGSIEIDGSSVVDLAWKERETLLRKVGMLFQNAALFDSMSVWQNITFGLAAQKPIPENEALEIAILKLAAVGLNADVARLTPAELSGGMRKRVGLARAIAGNPEILFFDEPTTGLDPIMSDVINELIVSCVKELGATALSITHDMASAKKIADRIAMLHCGEIIWTGSADQIFNSSNKYVEQFVKGRAEGPIHTEVLLP
ncbi:MAG: ABC transporter ATP-binding protein [Rhodospirillaceae bacterium]|nr:ABC transporter ATP-binding protein [Rhodospirillaceae bacterium]|tara:strand:- start:1174 stop:1953 length:780 start_codon:yes stop_codon:yes gene_type:complete